jgi:hypothetical protein
MFKKFLPALLAAVFGGTLLLAAGGCADDDADVGDAVEDVTEEVDN